MQTYAQGGGRNITYPLGLNAGSVGTTYGLGQHSFVIVDQNGIIQYISPQNVHYSRRYIEGEAEMIQIIESLLMTTGISEQDRQLPQSFKLYQNRPNPFRTATSIQIDVDNGAQSVPTTLKVYNILGQEIASLFRGRLSAGSHTFSWQGRNRNSNQVPGGVYFYVLESGAERLTKKLIYLAK